MGVECGGESRCLRHCFSRNHSQDQRQCRDPRKSRRSSAASLDVFARSPRRIPETATTVTGARGATMSRLKDRVAVVSGAATGIGRAVARRLAAKGAQVEILDRQSAAEACAEIRAAGGIANFELCDVTSETQIDKAVKAIEGRNSKVDILVNNAGILSGRQPWHTLS